MTKCPRCTNKMKLEIVGVGGDFEEPSHGEEHLVCQNPNCGYIDITDEFEDGDF